MDGVETIADAGEREAGDGRGPDAGIRKGGEDPAGARVVRVYERTQRYVIYLAEERGEAGALESLRWELPDDYDEAREMRGRLMAVAGLVAQITDAVASMKPFWRGRHYCSLRERSFRLMARSVGYAFEGHAERARELLLRLRDEVADRRDSLNRMRYIAANTMSFALIAGVLLAAREGWWLGLLAAEIPLIETVAVVPADMLLFGALGAFFSVAADVRSVRVNHAIAVSEMLYAGFVRIPIGLIGATVVMLLVGGGWILGSIETDLLTWSVHLFAFIAGFSEMFVQNALKDAEAGANRRAEHAAEGGDGR